MATTQEPTAADAKSDAQAELHGIAHLVLRTGDWSRAARWYQDVLGFERRKGDGFVCFARPGTPFILLFRADGTPGAPAASPTERLDHLALLVPTAESLEAWRRRLLGLGIEAEIERQAVGASITLHDPDGLEIELFCPAEDSPLSVPPQAQVDT